MWPPVAPKRRSTAGSIHFSHSRSPNERMFAFPSARKNHNSPKFYLSITVLCNIYVPQRSADVLLHLGDIPWAHWWAQMSLLFSFFFCRGCGVSQTHYTTEATRRDQKWNPFPPVSCSYFCPSLTFLHLSLLYKFRKENRKRKHNERESRYKWNANYSRIWFLACLILSHPPTMQLACQFTTQLCDWRDRKKYRLYVTRDSVVSWGTTLQAGIPWVRFPMLLDFFNLPDTFQPHTGPGVDSTSNRNEYQESSWG
jgi:hypothetical protein